MLAEAISICQTLQNNGYKALFVGGYVRDQYLKRPVKDIDIVTDAIPDTVESLFQKTLPIGKQFGVINVIINKYNFEVATFRSDGEYSDGRRPDSVKYGQIEEDAIRRDFTINALYYDPIINVHYDLVDGISDLNNEVVRFIGLPENRIQEDHLRMLRAVRFTSKLGFALHPESLYSIEENTRLINKVSKERIWQEFIKILETTNYRYALEELYDTGLLQEIFPELAALKGCIQPEEFHPEGDVWEHTILALESLDEDVEIEVVLGVLFHDIGKPEAREVTDRIRFNRHEKIGVRITEDIMTRYKCSNKLIKSVCELVENHMKFMTTKAMKKSTLKKFMRLDNFDWHLQLHRADCIGCHRSLDSYNYMFSQYSEFEELLKPDPLITGRDLISMGFKPSALFSTILEDIEDKQLGGEITTPEDAIKYVADQYKS